MQRIDTVVVGASAGGVEALSKLVSQLPENFPAALLIVIHFPESATSLLPSILSRQGPLPAKHAEDGEQLKAGRIYIAPPGKHMLVMADKIRLVVGPKENNNRPAIDPLFRTAARTCGPSVVGVILTGLLDDGTPGMAAIKQRGGITIAQDPDDALFADMPRNAIQNVDVDYILPLSRIGPKLAEIAGCEVPDWESEFTIDPTEMTLQELQSLESRGRPSAFVCPECHGTLFELTEDGIFHYRCRVGHSYLPETLASQQEGGIEAALWTALRALKEHNSLLARMVVRMEQRGVPKAAETYRQRLAEGDARIALLANVLGLERQDDERDPDEAVTNELQASAS